MDTPAKACQNTNYACKISVVIPVYNMAEYLEQSIASWTGQTLTDIEIICVNDASTDDSLSKLRELAAKDDRICIYSFSENKSAWSARKLGIAKARGEYIMFADADDTVLPETCEELYQQISTAQVDILHFKAEAIGTSGASKERIAGLNKWLSPYEGILTGTDVFTACFRDRKYNFTIVDKIYKAQVCKDAVANEKDAVLRRGEDKVLAFMILYTAQSYKGVAGKKYYQYYVGRGGTSDGSKRYTAKQFENFAKSSHCAKLIENFIQRQGTEYLYNDILKKNYTELLNDIISHWFLVKEEDKSHGFDLLLKYWKPDEVIGKLAERKFTEGAYITNSIQHSLCLKYDGHPVKTIATYYHRLANDGLERVLCQLCHLWTAMGYRVLVLTDKAPCNEDYPLPSGVERIVLPDWEAVTPQTYHERATVLRRILHDHHVDAVVHHAWGNRLLLWDELVIKAAGAACLIHCHNIFSIGLWGGGNYEALGAPYLLADATVVLSKTDYAFWKYFNNNVHVTVNPLSENIADWLPSSYTPNHSILWLARLDPNQKCPMDLIPIMEEVVRVVPDAVLHVVGKSENGSIETALREEIARHHLEGHIILEGFHTDVKPWYKTCQVFLLTSAFEGYCLTLAESKMAGIPCVMYELPYLTLCEGNRGILPVPQRDIRAAARALCSLLTDDDLCASMGRDARAHIEELARFDFQKKWHQIFESIEHPHAPLVSKTDKLMMETLIDYHVKGLQDAKNCLHNARMTRKEAIKVLIPNRLKPFLKAILRHIPSGVKKPIKRLLHW